MSSPSRPGSGYVTAEEESPVPRAVRRGPSQVPTNNEGYVTAEGSPPSSQKYLSKAQRRRLKEKKKAAAASATVAALPSAVRFGVSESAAAENLSGFTIQKSKAQIRAEKEAEAERQRQRKREEEAEDQRKREEAAEAERKRKHEEAAARKREEEAARRLQEAEERQKEIQRKAREAEEAEKAERKRREEQRRKEAEEARIRQEELEARLVAEKAAKEAKEKRLAIESARQSRRSARHARKSAAASRKATSRLRSPSRSPPERILPGENLGSNRPQTIADLNLTRQYNATQPFLQAPDVQYFTLIVATEIFKMLYSNSLIDYMIAHIKSSDIKKQLKSKPNHVYRFYLKGGGATEVIKRMMLELESSKFFNFSNDLDFSFIVNPSLPVGDARKIRAIAFAAVLDLISNICGRFNPDVPHILRPKDLRRLNGIYYDFNLPFISEILHRGSYLHSSELYDIVQKIIIGRSADDEVNVSGNISLHDYVDVKRPLGKTTNLSTKVTMNPSLHSKSLNYSVITLATRSEPEFTLLDVTFPTTDNDKIHFEWDLTMADTHLLKAPINHRGYEGKITFPVIGPVSNFVDQKYSALPFTETRPAKLASRQARAAALARNILIPRAANLTKTIRKISTIRFKNKDANGKNITRKAGNLIRENMGAAYPE